VLLIHSGLSQEAYCDAKENSMGHMLLSLGEEIKNEGPIQNGRSNEPIHHDKSKGQGPIK
jgi:hypothetical protein